MTGLLIVLVLVPACQKTYSVTIANPCSQDVEVTTYVAPQAHEDTRGNTGMVPALSSVKIDHAFYGDSTTSWSMVVTGTGIDEVLAVDAQEIVDGLDVVVIPADVCADVGG